MSMAHDFELRHLTDKLKKLAEEQTLTNQQILKCRRDEQFDLESTRRRYNGQINALEEKLRRTTKDLETYERQLRNLEKTIADDKVERRRTP